MECVERINIILPLKNIPPKQCLFFSRAYWHHPNRRDSPSFLLHSLHPLSSHSLLSLVKVDWDSFLSWLLDVKLY